MTQKPHASCPERRFTTANFIAFLAILVTLHISQFTLVGLVYMNSEEKLEKIVFQQYQATERLRTERILEKLSRMEAKLEILIQEKSSQDRK